MGLLRQDRTSTILCIEMDHMEIQAGITMKCIQLPFFTHHLVYMEEYGEFFCTLMLKSRPDITILRNCSWKAAKVQSKFIND
ncbi:hypothetical protein EGR_10624 [Echinococcus granulosus]|uniref:Uncharacterized protein n=1 Tax=Echinococcus granulosus TaxID=6210 RepID=W6UM03_ECHGR|nr:hypothetical protein EGR_10624 [Echinococcus granulosus]EUB54514.1 hypothetical protein EGR_10624 [Echinococcus granulosus]